MFKTTELITGSTMQEAFDNAVKAAERRVLDNPPENPDEAPFTLAESEGFEPEPEVAERGLSKVEAIAVASIIDCKYWGHSTFIAPVVDESTLGETSIVRVPMFTTTTKEKMGARLNSVIGDYMEDNTDKVVISAEVVTASSKKTDSTIQTVIEEFFFVQPVSVTVSNLKSKNFNKKQDAITYATKLAREGIDVTLESSERTLYEAVGVERTVFELTVREVTPETKPLAGQWWAMSDYTPPR